MTVSTIPTPPLKPSADLGKVLYDLQVAINTDITAVNGYSAANFNLGKLLNSTITTTGTAPTFLLNTANVVFFTTYAVGHRLRVKFHAANAGGACTLNVNSLGAKLIKTITPYGVKVDPVINSGDVIDVEYDGADFVCLFSSAWGGSGIPKFRAEHSLSTAQSGILSFNTEKYDTKSNYDAINKFTAPYAGYYQFAVTFRNGAAENYSWFLKNGVQLSETLVTPINASANHSAVFYLAANDYIQYTVSAATYAAANILKFEGYLIV